MNIKIKADGVLCLVSKDYEQIYLLLRNHFGNDERQLFTERQSGHGYLQWILPDEGWQSLANADAVMQQKVRMELEQRKLEAMNLFGKNKIVAQRVVTVPDEGFIYFKTDDKGELHIRLTAWGYKFPERIGGPGADGTISPARQQQSVHVKVLCDGKPAAKVLVMVNKNKFATNPQGIVKLGKLDLGSELDVAVENESRHIVVTDGQEEILFETESPKAEQEIIPEPQPEPQPEPETQPIPFSGCGISRRGPPCSG